MLRKKKQNKELKLVKFDQSCRKEKKLEYKQDKISGKA